MINDETKESIFKQINEFRKNILTKTGKDVYEYRFYVEPETAIDRAKFFKFFDTEKTTNELTYNKVIDLTFGSGNLTSHILLDNDIEFSKLILNDKNIDDANFSDELGEIAEEITDNNILINTSFDEDDKFDLIIFNPQIGGKDRNVNGVKVDGYKKGMLLDSLQIQLAFHEFGQDLFTALSSYVNLSDCIICIDDSEHSIRIHSNILSKTDMNTRFEKIKIFNYYDLFYQSKKGKIEGAHSDIVKFRMSLEKIINNNTTIAFMGNNEEFNIFFHEFNMRYVYKPEKGKSFVIGYKGDTNEILCYKRDGSDFIEVDCEQTYQAQQIDLKETLDGIHNVLSDLKALDGGELFVLDDKTGICTESKTKSVEAISEQNKPQKPRFKNFLLAYIVKETK